MEELNKWSWDLALHKCVKSCTSIVLVRIYDGVRIRCGPCTMPQYISIILVYIETQIDIKKQKCENGDAFYYSFGLAEAEKTYLRCEIKRDNCPSDADPNVCSMYVRPQRSGKTILASKPSPFSWTCWRLNAPRHQSDDRKNNKK